MEAKEQEPNMWVSGFQGVDNSKSEIFVWSRVCRQEICYEKRTAAFVFAETRTTL